MGDRARLRSGGDRWDDSELPNPAAPAVVLVRVYRCETCADTGRGLKPSAWFAAKTTEGFCPDCTRHYDFASRRFRNCGAYVVDLNLASKQLTDTATLSLIKEEIERV